MSWLPSVVALNCIDDYAMEQDHFSGVAAVKHVPLSHLADGRIDSASAVVLQSFAYLPCAAQRRLRPYQLILCLGSGDCSTDSTFTADLGCQSSMAGFPAFTATKFIGDGLHLQNRRFWFDSYNSSKIVVDYYVAEMLSYDAKCGTPTWICKGLTYFLICRPSFTSISKAFDLLDMVKAIKGIV